MLSYLRRAILPLLRDLIRLFALLALFGAAVAHAVRYPNGPFNKTMLSIAGLPAFVADTLRNLWLDPYAASRAPDDFSARHAYRPVANHTHHRIEGLVIRRGNSADAPQTGWRLLYGVFQIDGAPRYAALALSPAFAIEHVWLISRADVGDTGLRFGQAPFPHGLALLRDGSIVAGFDTIYPTVRIGPCGGRVWASEIPLTHAIAPVDGERRAWGVGPNDNIIEIDLATGRTIRVVTAAAIAAVNPDVTGLDMMRIDENGVGSNSRAFAEGYHADPFHINDVEPLPATLAPRFPMFRTGDLLLSFRSINMVAVMDPATLRIKWATNSISFRQHDPDWEANGEISLLDNEMGRGFSRILAIDPATNRHRIVLAGEALNFTTRIRGKHQSLANGNLLVTSAGQGRIFELGRDGRIASEILVRDPTKAGNNFVVSEAVLIPPSNPALAKVRTCRE